MGACGMPGGVGLRNHAQIDRRALTEARGWAQSGAKFNETALAAEEPEGEPGDRRVGDGFEGVAEDRPGPLRRQAPSRRLQTGAWLCPQSPKPVASPPLPDRRAGATGRDLRYQRQLTDIEASLRSIIETACFRRDWPKMRRRKKGWETERWSRARSSQRLPLPRAAHRAADLGGRPLVPT
jgi:hypothetical protein